MKNIYLNLETRKLKRFLFLFTIVFLGSLNVYFVKADSLEAILKEMTLEEKVGQMFMGITPEEQQERDIHQHQLGACVLFENNFKGKRSLEEVRCRHERYQKVSKIPILITADEEGGRVTRISRNEKLIGEKFLLKKK